MKELLKEENVSIVSKVDDWKEAINVSLTPLLEQDYITASYPEAVISLTEKYGPYYVLAPYTALVHARPEDGVLKNQIAVTLLKEEVYFSEDKPVKLLIALAANNSKEHLNALQKIGELLMEDDCIDSLLSVKTATELYEKFTL